MTLVGGVSEYNRRTGKTTIDRVEVQASPTNEIQFFGDEQANRDFGTEYDTAEAYEDLTELYLDGGIESDDSPIDQFELLRYQHQIYPREGNTYLGHVRGRNLEMEIGYWRDLRPNRTETGSVDNGFGFTVPSQSIWPLDVEDGWATRDLNATVGAMTMSGPTAFAYNSNKTLADGIKLDMLGDGFGSSDDIYLYAKTAVNVNSTSGFTYNSSLNPPEGIVQAAKYTLNSFRGVGRYYDAWMGLMESVQFRIDNEKDL